MERILGNNIYALRKASRFKTQEALAAAADIPFRTYQDIERGVNWPQKRNLEAIAKALGVDESVLFASEIVTVKPTAKEALKIVEQALKASELRPILRRLIDVAASLDDSQVTYYLGLMEAEISPPGKNDEKAANSAKKASKN